MTAFFTMSLSPDKARNVVASENDDPDPGTGSSYVHKVLGDSGGAGPDFIYSR